MAGGRQKRTENRPATALFSTPRSARYAIWGLCSLLGIAMSTPAFAQVRSNRNVPTWTWADEVVQPSSNAAVAPEKRPTESPIRQIIRQLLKYARQEAQRGEFDIAESLAKRADLLLKESLAINPEVWDPAEQPPGSFLRQLAEFRARQASIQASKKPASESPDTPVVKNNSEAPGPPSLDLSEPEFSSEPAVGEIPGLVLDPNQPSSEFPNSLNGSPDSGLKTSQTANMPGQNDAFGENSSAVPDQLNDFAPPAVAQQSEQGDVRQSVAAAAPPPPPVTERIIQIQGSPEKDSSSMLAAAMVHLLSTAAGIVLGILVLVGVRAFLKKRYNADFGFVFRVEHVATGEDGMYLPYTYFPGAQPSEPFPMPTAGPGRDGVAAVLTELPAGFQSDELSSYEEQLQREEEAENEMMKLVLQQNLELRQALGGQENIAA